MCAYKLVTVKFKWWGLQNKVENFIQKVCLQLRLFSPLMIVMTSRETKLKVSCWAGIINNLLFNMMMLVSPEILVLTASWTVLCVKDCWATVHANRAYSVSHPEHKCCTSL